MARFERRGGREESLNTDDALKSFLQEANEPRDKALIIVLMDINRNLQATANDLADNTKLTEQLGAEFVLHQTAFTNHVVEERQLLAQGRGAYKGLTATVALIGILFSAIGIMGAYIGRLHIERLDSLIGSDARQELRVTTMEQQIKEFERRFFTNR